MTVTTSLATRVLITCYRYWIDSKNLLDKLPVLKAIRSTKSCQRDQHLKEDQLISV